ncbi:hypothetical protein EVAR_51812_1 [Eumeta japonica]|uniref:Uncharacterized protein n=1 Tax=Eumeta variegata TaxID=151549 RepID=A0A4C1Y010_EUMVA|nr:hypothetical protein EVAR_51812_1 [Eumeta japonica]
MRRSGRLAVEGWWCGRAMPAPAAAGRANNGALALHYAAARGCLDCVRLLTNTTPDVSIERGDRDRKRNANWNRRKSSPSSESQVGIDIENRCAAGVEEETSLGTMINDRDRPTCKDEGIHSVYAGGGWLMYENT